MGSTEPVLVAWPAGCSLRGTDPALSCTVASAAEDLVDNVAFPVSRLDWGKSLSEQLQAD